MSVPNLAGEGALCELPETTHTHTQGHWETSLRAAGLFNSLPHSLSTASVEGGGRRANLARRDLLTHFTALIWIGPLTTVVWRPAVLSDHLNDADFLNFGQEL